MRPERWGRIEDLCHAAAAREGDARAAFLDEACGSDVALRQEVESLLAGESAAGSFLETPVSRASALAPGTRLGPYEVVGLIGSGGMGEVYRATDTSLGRQVAIKVLPAAFAADPERIARFEREARTLASLNHPNIAAIYGLERIDPSAGSGQGGTAALVLELVEGPTLADRIAGGPIPVDEALPLARQIVEALEAAHEHGIIHRDLKPANVKVREDGTVKVLDFGLAKALEAPGADADEANAPTATSPATQVGVILGTAAYMSPEQAKGRRLDRRSDVWAFGAVFYEMLTGRRAFDGDEVSEVLAEIIKSEPDWHRLPALPPLLESFLRQCFKKDPRQRLPDVAAMRLALEGTFEAGVATSVTAARPAWRRALPLAVALVVGGLLASLAWGLRATPEPSVTRFDRVLPVGQEFRYTWRAVVAFAADGRHFVYNTTDGLFLRSMDDLEARLIPGTEADLGSPFFSPDGASVGYFDPATQQLKRIPVSGGAPLLICGATIPYGASWEIDDTILFGQPEGIRRVSATGGAPDLVIPARPGERIDGPHLLPDGESVLFSATTDGGATGWDRAQIVVQSLRTGERTVVLDGGSDARYVPTGHLVYARQNDLFAVAFDADRLTLQGRPARVVEGVTRSTNATAATAHYGFSDDGTLVYVAGLGPGPPLRTVVWIGRDGREEALPIASSMYFYPRMSPDGTRVALDDRNEDFDHGEIWIWDFAKQTRDLLTREAGGGNYPVWTPGGDRVAYGNDAGGEIEWRAANGTDAPQVLVRSPDQHEGSLRNPYFFASSPSGLELVFRNWYEDPQTGNDIFRVAMKDGAEPVSILSEAFDETNAELSPNGRWMAYQSDESGQDEIYVRPYPNVNDNRVQVSTAGGTKPLWSRDGSELFYLEPPALLMSVAVEADGIDFSLGRRLPLPDVRMWNEGGGRNYDVSLDGQTFLVITPVPPMTGAGVGSAPSRLIVVQNWFEDLKAKVRQARR